MALFKRKKQEDKTQNIVADEKAKETTVVSKTATNKSFLNGKSVLIKPLITEKAAHLASLNKYVFLVDKNANKVLVKQEVAARYNVRVESVDIVNIKGKVKYYKNRPYKKGDIKKAIVTLKKGEKIEIQ